MVDCPVSETKNVKERICPQCDTDLTPLHRLKELPKVYYIKGIKLAEQGNLDRAIENLMTAISLNPDSAETYIAVGNIYVRKGLHADALVQFEKALKIDSGNEEAKKAKERSEEERARLKETQFKQTRKFALYKKLLIGVPVAAFLAGLMIIPLLKNLISQPSIDYPALAEKIKKNITNYPIISGLNIDVTPADKGLNISGKVPTDLHKNLITEIAKNVAGNNTVDMQNLLIVPIREKVPEFLYTVKSGDTLMLIAYRFYGDSQMWNRIWEANRDKITNANRVSIGQHLSIPVK